MSKLDATVLICTFNRSELLGDALDSLARMRQGSARRWEVLIVDNNSTDGTRAVVETRQAAYPVPLRYLFEPRQGKSYALNTGIQAADGRIIVFGDDDQEFADDWVDEACAPLDADASLEYTGGPVLPLWRVRQPSWFDASRAEFLGPLGLFDYGPTPFVLEERRSNAGGGNMAVRRTVFDRIGGFSVDLGRTGTSLLGQEQAEFFMRSRAAGARGLYVPSMIVYHHIPPDRVRKQYFRRWWFWRGVSRARVDAMHATRADAQEASSLPQWFGIPRYKIRRALGDAVAWVRSWFGGREADRLVAELHLALFAGYVRERWWGTQPPSPVAVEARVTPSSH